MVDIDLVVAETDQEAADADTAAVAAVHIVRVYHIDYSLVVPDMVALLQ